MRLIATSPEDDDEGYDEAVFAKIETRDEDDEDEDDDTSDETGDVTKLEVVEKRKKKLRLARLRRKTKARAYEFTGTGDVIGIVFLEIVKITDLPPERNGTLLSGLIFSISNNVFEQLQGHHLIWILLSLLHWGGKHIVLESSAISSTRSTTRRWCFKSCVRNSLTR